MYGDCIYSFKHSHPNFLIHLGPVSAARTLLTKSRNDYYSSCETAQENQVDHALVSHYQQSVVNRKKVSELIPIINYLKYIYYLYL